MGIKQVLCLFCAVMALALMTGCATIFTGTSQEVSFVSNPEGATVAVSGKVLGKAPLTARLDKKEGQSITFEKEGYKTASMRLDTHLNPWFWGNIVFGGFLGSTTDGASGAAYEYSPSQYMITLEPAGTGRIDGPAMKNEAQKAKEFIVVGYANLLNDLRAGSGPHLSSLLTMLQIPQENKDDATKKIRSLSEVYTEIPEFADHVISLYVK